MIKYYDAIVNNTSNQELQSIGIARSKSDRSEKPEASGVERDLQSHSRDCE